MQRVFPCLESDKTVFCEEYYVFAQETYRRGQPIVHFEDVIAIRLEYYQPLPALELQATPT